MISTTLYILSLATLSIAQSSVVSLILPLATPQNFSASIAGSDSTATTFIIPCPPATSSNSSQVTGSSNSSSNNNDFDNAQAQRCGFTSTLTVTQGPSMLKYAFSMNSVIASIDCSFTGTTKAVCDARNSAQFSSGSDVASASRTRITLQGTDFPAYTPVTITAGLGNAKVTWQASNNASTASSGTGGSATSAAVAKNTGGSGGMMVEPALALGAAGALAVGLMAILL